MITSSTINRITLAFPNLSFVSAQTFMWSAHKKIVFFDPKRVKTPKGIMGLLNEIGHATLEHQNFEYDIDLLKMEVGAWQKAQKIGHGFEIVISPKHIDECLESYRLWIFKRSRCPQCQNTGIQINATNYRCFMCANVWRVARNCSSTRPRRMCVK
jgi:hypothetical protein